MLEIIASLDCESEEVTRVGELAALRAAVALPPWRSARCRASIPEMFPLVWAGQDRESLSEVGCWPGIQGLLK